MEPHGDETARAGRFDLDESPGLGDQQADGLPCGFSVREPHRERRAVMEDGLDHAIRHDALRPAEERRPVAFEQPDQPDVRRERLVDGELAVPDRHGLAGFLQHLVNKSACAPSARLQSRQHAAEAFETGF